jgi:SAM-dependent methyltransferase
VKAEFVEQLRCQACLREHTLVLCAEDSDEREVRDGFVRCSACTAEFAVRRGVPELLHDPAPYIVKEVAGLERFAEQMRLEGWGREMVRKLPNLENGYWYVQARSMYQLLSTIPFWPRQSILDVGSNTCWAANQFAELGLEAIALDIATAELQGLYTAEYFIDDGHVFFERVLGSMDAIPLASSSVDYVYCCEVLHHNDVAGLRRTFAEAFRVLRPGGRLLMVNETLKTFRDPSGVHLQGVEQYEGHEHAHWAMRYRWEATRAGFFTEVTEPHYRAFFGDTELVLEPGTAPLRAWGRRIGFALRRLGVARRIYLAWLNHFAGGVSMNMVATKPRRFVGRHEPIAVPQRLLRTASAGLRVKAARFAHSRAVPPRLPRSPEQAAAAAHAPAAARPVRGSRPPAGRSG